MSRSTKSLRRFYAPPVEGIGWEGRLVFRDRNNGMVFLDNFDRVFVYKHSAPKRGELFLRPTGQANRWQVELAQHDFAKKTYKIVGKRTNSGS